MIRNFEMKKKMIYRERGRHCATTNEKCKEHKRELNSATREERGQENHRHTGHQHEGSDAEHIDHTDFANQKRKNEHLQEWMSSKFVRGKSADLEERPRSSLRDKEVPAPLVIEMKAPWFLNEHGERGLAPIEDPGHPRVCKRR